MSEEGVEFRGGSFHDGFAVSEQTTKPTFLAIIWAKAAGLHVHLQVVGGSADDKSLISALSHPLPQPKSAHRFPITFRPL